jgi:hypothetical protein
MQRRLAQQFGDKCKQGKPARASLRRRMYPYMLNGTGGVSAYGVYISKNKQS